MENSPEKKTRSRAEFAEERIIQLEQQLDDITREKKQRHHLYIHKDVNKGEKSFVEGLSVYNLIWVFIIASFVGVVSETVLHYLTSGQLVRTSGMLYGPFNQVYGCAAVVAVLLLYRFRDRNNLVIFLVSMMLGMSFEYLVSYTQELLFGSTSWDYSGMKGNIGGRTNLLFGLGWGVMGLLFIVHFWPWMSEMIARIPNKIGKPLTVVVTVLLMANLSLSAAAVLRESDRQKGIAATNPVAVWLDATYPNSVIAAKYPEMNFGAIGTGNTKNSIRSGDESHNSETSSEAGAN